MLFSPEERQRYARQLDLPGFGSRAQELLRKGRVFVVGCGGLGSPALTCLAAAGVGTIGFADGDIVDLSNLQRQVLHATSDIGRPKTASAESRLRALNPHVALRPHDAPLTAGSAPDILSPYDFVIDATDSFAAKAMIADVCAALRKPWVFGAVDAFAGQMLTVLPGRTPCLRCAFPDAPPPRPPGTPPAGPLGGITGVVGSLQAMEAVKYLAGVGELHTGALLLYDGLAATFQSLRLSPRPGCPCCALARGPVPAPPEARP